MDDLTDIAIYRIEKDIERNRDAEPCEDYERTSQLIPYCKWCGWAHSEDDR